MPYLFQIFSEKPAESPDGMRAVNFITGMGGLLQAVLFGYGGIRQKETTMEMNPYVLPGANSWKILGLKYRGYDLDLDIDASEVQVTLTYDPDDGNDLVLMVEGSETEILLKEGETETVSRGKVLFAMKPTSPTPTEADGAQAVSVSFTLALVMAVIAKFM